MHKDTPVKRVGSIMYWTMWVILALLCALMLTADFSVSRLIGSLAIIVSPLVLRRTLFKRFVPALLSWAAAFVLFFIVMAITGQLPTSETGMTVLKSGGVTVSMLQGVMPEGAAISVVKDKNPPSPTIEGVVLDCYDVTLPTNITVEGVAEMKLPFDKKQIPTGLTPSEVLSAAYFNTQTSTWEAVPYMINADESTLTIFTDHFSKYAVVYFKDGRKKLAEKLPEFDGMSSTFYTVSELEGIVNDMVSGSASSPAAFTAGWNKFNVGYGLAGASGNILQAAVDSKTLNNVNNLMTEAGMGFAFAQLALDIYSGDNNAAVNNFVKNATSYSASKWAGSAVNLASAGVTFMDIAINKFAEKALDKNLQKWEDAYRKYYNTNPKARRSAVDWYNVVKTLHTNSSGPEDFKGKLDAAISEYCNKFWIDAEGYAYVAESTPGIVGFSAGGEWGLGVEQLTARYKQYIYGTTMKPVMEVLMKNLWYQECKRADAKLKALRAEMNKVYTVTVNLSNYDKVKNLNGTGVRFKNKEGQVVHSQSFDASGRAVLKMTLFAFLKNGGPLEAEVLVPAQDSTPEYRTTIGYKLTSTNITLTAPYAPGTTPTESDNKQPGQTAEEPSTPETPGKTDPPKTEYNYSAALGAWAADFAAEVNRRVDDDGKCISTREFEWVMAPVIKDGQIIGAHKIWMTDKYYAGPRKDETVRYLATEVYDAANPGPYLSLGDLKKKYPQFGQ